MAQQPDALEHAREAFIETIRLKLQQLRRVVPKSENPELTGDYVEEVVRGFIKDWIAPCRLMTGTFFPHDSNENVKPEFQNPKQIDGIVYDPRLGPAVIHEGNFVVTHPIFCRGVIEIKTSVTSVKSFHDRLRLLYNQYLYPFDAITPQVMGIVIEDSDPATRSNPKWFRGPVEQTSSPKKGRRSAASGKKPRKGKLVSRPLYDFNTVPICPIFILFDTNYEPHVPAIDAMIRAIFTGPLQLPRPPM